MVSGNGYNNGFNNLGFNNNGYNNLGYNNVGYNSGLLGNGLNGLNAQSVLVNCSTASSKQLNHVT